MEQIFSVSEFVEFIDEYLRTAGEVWVEGEISSLQISQGKWLFINIKDDQSVLSVFGVAYKIYNHRLLEEGMMVKIRGVSRLHRKSGKFSLFAEEIVPSGEGALRLAFEKLRTQLEKEGLFDIDRKRPIPEFPETIGLITAKKSRAMTDFVKVLKNRMGGIKIYFYPVVVQGVEAVSSLISAFNYFNTHLPHLDLVVMTRGGGSLEELAPFNDERVVRAVFGSSFPVVSAVGHEEDVSLCDLAADMRASTPSNAAELIVKSRSEIIQMINFKLSHIENYLVTLLNSGQIRLQHDISIINTNIQHQVHLVDRLIRRLGSVFGLFIADITNRHQIIFQQATALVKRQETLLFATYQSVSTLTRLLNSLDYNSVLKRGFSISLNKDNKIIKEISQVGGQEPMTTTLYRGKIYSKVIAKKSI